MYRLDWVINNGQVKKKGAPFVPVHGAVNRGTQTHSAWKTPFLMTKPVLHQTCRHCVVIAQHARASSTVSHPLPLFYYGYIMLPSDICIVTLWYLIHLIKYLCKTSSFFQAGKWESCIKSRFPLALLQKWKGTAGLVRWWELIQTAGHLLF